MFILGTISPIAGACRPTVIVHLHLPSASRNHWLNGDGHTFLETQALALGSVMWDTRFFVDGWTNAVADKVTDYPVTLSFSRGLNSVADIPNAIAD